MQVLQFCLFTVEGRIRLLQTGKDYARIVGICALSLFTGCGNGRDSKEAELADKGFDKYGDGEHLFPYTLVTPDGFTLEENKTYTVVICGVSDAVQEEGNIQDTGIVGLTAAQEYLSQFDTLSAADIIWEQNE